MMKRTRMFHAVNDVIHVQTLWSQKVVLNVFLQKEFTMLDGLPHVSKNVIYIAFCLSYQILSDLPLIGNLDYGLINSI